jgi:peptide-methionine (S)-S-oxide reductase
MSSNPGYSERNNGVEVATLAGGCFWCLEAIFDELEGVERVVSGYSGGKTENPSYKDVCGGRTGHAEAVQIVFDPKVISYREILALFFSMHDPTTLNRQGADVGTQYRSVIFYHDDKQKAIAEQLIKELNAAKIWKTPIVTEVKPFTAFYPAEDYHRNYFQQNTAQPYCQVVIAPKLAKFRNHYSDKLKKKR